MSKINIYTQYKPDELRDTLMYTELNADELGGAVIVLCNMIQALAERVSKLEQALQEIGGGHDAHQ